MALNRDEGPSVPLELVIFLASVDVRPLRPGEALIGLPAKMSVLLGASEADLLGPADDALDTSKVGTGAPLEKP